MFLNYFCRSSFVAWSARLLQVRYFNICFRGNQFLTKIIVFFSLDLLDSAFSGFRFEGSFGQFRTDRYILFNVADGKVRMKKKNFRHRESNPGLLGESQLS